MQDELGLNVYDYGNRNYDPAIGRFFNIDRFAEKYNDRTPYNYAANNPILYIDVQGDSIFVANKNDQAKVLKMINSKAVGSFAFSKTGHLYLANAKGDATKYSQYYTDKLVAAIGASETIEIEIKQITKKPVFAADGKTIVKEGSDEEVNLDTRKYSGGVTWGATGTDQLVVISGNGVSSEKDTFGKELIQTAADILAHELVGHAIPSIVGSDTGNAVDNENKVRKQLNQPERAGNLSHVE